MSSTAASLLTVLATCALLHMSHGLDGVLWPITMVEHGFSAVTIGFAGGAFGIGFVTNCLLSPRVVRAVGHVRSYMVHASIWSVALLIFPAVTHPVWWIVLPAVLGASMAGTNTVLDSWVASISTPSTRGRILSVYMVVVRLSAAIGALLLSFGSPGEAWLFMLASAILSLSVVPIGILKVAAPAPPAPRMLGPLQVLHVSPVGVFGALTAGAGNATVFQLLPLYATTLGFDKNQISVLISSILVCSMTVTIIVGFLSDRMDRRLLLVLLALLGASAGLSLVIIGSPTFYLLLLLILLWSAGSMSLYPVNVAHALDRAESDQTTPIVSSLLLFWAAGATVGPVIASWAIRGFGPQGLPSWLSFICTAFMMLTLIRMTTRESADHTYKRLHLFPQTSLQLNRLIAKRIYSKKYTTVPAKDSPVHQAEPADKPSTTPQTKP